MGTDCVSDRMYVSIGHCSCKDRSHALPLRSQHPCTQRALAAPCLGCKQFQVVNCLWHAKNAPAYSLSTKPSLSKHCCMLIKKWQGTHRFTCSQHHWCLRSNVNQTLTLLDLPQPAILLCMSSHPSWYNCCTFCSSSLQLFSYVNTCLYLYSARLSVIICCLHQTMQACKTVVLGLCSKSCQFMCP